MKKILTITSLLLAFLLCMTVASAASVTNGDMTHIEVDVENPQAAADFYLEIVAEAQTEHATHWDACQIEIARVSEAESLQNYFKDAVDPQGIPFDAAAALEAQELYCYEFVPVIAGNYTDEMGVVTARFLFPTPYEKGEQVVVMIGLVSVDEEGMQTVRWIAQPGVVVEAADQGICIETVLTPDTVIGIQEGVALLAVLSR